jgi:hemoglobin
MSELNEELVARLLDAFYAKVRRDPELAPVFEGIIGDGWPAHMKRIEAFWQMAMRISRGYHGPDFMPAHLKHGSIQAGQLERWLALFEETVDEIVPPDLRARFMHVANAMADNLRISLARREL